MRLILTVQLPHPQESLARKGVLPQQSPKREASARLRALHNPELDPGLARRHGIP